MPDELKAPSRETALEQGPVLNLLYVQQDPGRDTEKLLVLSEPDFCPWRELYRPVLPKFRLHHGGKQGPLLKSLQTGKNLKCR